MPDSSPNPPDTISNGRLILIVLAGFLAEAALLAIFGQSPTIDVTTFKPIAEASANDPIEQALNAQDDTLTSMGKSPLTDGERCVFRARMTGTDPTACPR